MRYFVHSIHLTVRQWPIPSGGGILDSLKLILAGAGLSDVLATVARLIEAQRPGMLCSIFLLELDGLRLRYAAAPNRPEAYRAATDGMVIGPNIGSRGRAAFLRQPVFASDIHSDPDWANFRDAAALAGLGAAWPSPIMSHDSGMLATFGMYYREVRYPEPSDIQLIQYASSIAGIAIERERSRTELTKAFEEVKKSKRQLQQTVDAIPQTIVVLRLDVDVEYANRTVLDYTGLSSDGLIGSDFRPKIIHPEDMERLRETRRLGFSRGLPWENELRVRGKDGQYRWFLFRYSPLLDDHGHVVRWCVAGTEIDRRKRDEERLHEENMALREEIDRSTILRCLRRLWDLLNRSARFSPKSAKWLPRTRQS
jgi:PAS domain S-box-containing protein